MATEELLRARPRGPDLRITQSLQALSPQWTNKRHGDTSRFIYTTSSCGSFQISLTPLISLKDILEKGPIE